MAGDEGRHRLAGREPYRAACGVGETSAAAMDSLGGALHRLDVDEQLLAGRGWHEAVGQAVEQAGVIFLPAFTLRSSPVSRYVKLVDLRQIRP